MSNDNDTLLSLTFGPDPSRDPQGVDSLRFEGFRPGFQLDTLPRFTPARNWQLFDGALLALAHDCDGHCNVIGSAVVVAPGVALAATHVVRANRCSTTGGVLNPTALWCLGITRHGAVAWQVTGITHTPNTDVCILGLRYATIIPPDRRFMMASISTRAPAIGEQLVMAGFRAADTAFPWKDHNVDIEAGIIVSTGQITECYQQGRDSSRMPWPSLEVDCPTIGGMSGGAVFDSRGFLIGVISSSFECGPHTEPAPTYVALLWPMLGLKFQGGWPIADPACTWSSLLDLGPRCQIERPDAIHIRREGNNFITDYDAWT
jgi:hypothetical protein